MRPTIPLALVPLFALACGSTEHGPPERASWSQVSEAELSPSQREQRASALAAKEELATRLVSALTEALLEGPPAEAIYVCQELAPRVARELGAERGLAIGRTSHRLRNPDNAPPAWAAPLVEARVEEPRTLAGEQGQLALLLPIRLGPQCVACHGAEAELDADVRAALAGAYPEDRATGFAPGELRGWFWVEVP